MSISIVFILLVIFFIIFCVFFCTQTDQDTSTNACNVPSTETAQKTDVNETEPKATVEASVPGAVPQQTSIANAEPGIYCYRICLIFFLNY